MKQPLNPATHFAMLLMVLTMFTTAFSANATITKEEWAKLMQDAEFKTVDQKLGAAYKQAMAALPETDKQKLTKEQRAWVSKREHDAFAKFSKGTHDYKRFLIDKANERIAELERYNAKTLKFTQTVKFKDKAIPMTVFCSTVQRGEMAEGINPDSLVFVYDGKNQTVHLEPLALYWYDVDPNNFHQISVEDYNFDNYMDFDMVSSYGSGGEWRNIYIYNPQTKSYAFQAKLSELAGVWADAKTKTVKSHGKGGHAGMIYSFREFKWEQGKLMLIQEEEQDYDDNSDKYIRITRTLQNGKWVEQKKTVTDME